MEMLTERAVAYLLPLKFCSTAERKICFLPLSGIYWDDEIPDFGKLMKMPETDRWGIYRLLSIRLKIWDGVEPDGEDKEFWDAARAQVPEYALFRRLALSEEDRTVHETVAREVEEGLNMMLADADEVTITEKTGVQTHSVTFDLTKKAGATQPPKPWWKRLFRL